MVVKHLPAGVSWQDPPPVSMIRPWMDACSAAERNVSIPRVGRSGPTSRPSAGRPCDPPVVGRVGPESGCSVVVRQFECGHGDLLSIDGDIDVFLITVKPFGGFEVAEPEAIADEVWDCPRSMSLGVPVKDSVRGFVFDVATGRLAEVG